MMTSTGEKENGRRSEEVQAILDRYKNILKKREQMPQQKASRDLSTGEIHKYWDSRPWYRQVGRKNIPAILAFSAALALPAAWLGAIKYVEAVTDADIAATGGYELVSSQENPNEQTLLLRESGIIRSIGPAALKDTSEKLAEKGFMVVEKKEIPLFPKASSPGVKGYVIYTAKP